MTVDTTTGEVVAVGDRDPDAMLVTATKMLAEASTVEDAANLIDYAEAARVFAQRAHLGTKSINYATGIKLKAELRLARFVDLAQEHGHFSRGRPGKVRAANLSDAGLHKRQVAEARLVAEALPDDEAIDAIVEAANDADAEVARSRLIRDARTARRRQRKQDIADATPPSMPDGPFDLILADPPWRYEENVADATRVLDNHYPTMTMDELKAMSIPAADDAVLLMWATSPLLPQQLEVMRAWGFQYRTCAVWVKDRPGMGMYWRQAHELLLLGVRGTPGVPEPADRPSSVISAPRVEHSRKPDVVHEMAQAMFPHLPRRVELFARRERDGWQVWGNQA